MLINKKELNAEADATGVLSNYKDNTDPKYIGPGVWSVIHRQAFSSQTIDQQNYCIIFIKQICYGFPCKICRGHSIEYIKNHPLEEYLGATMDGKLLGLFIWTWKFHNSVNARLKKPIMSWATASTLYGESNSNICTANCLAADSENASNKPRNYTPLSEL